MKVQLERTLANVPSTLTCSACASDFNTPRIRTLLCHDHGQIYGDLCPSCIKAGAAKIQGHFQTKAITLLQQCSFQEAAMVKDCSNSIATYRQGLINQEIATSPLSMPKFYHWWQKSLEIYAAETQELEKARFAPACCQYRKSKLRIVFQPDTNLK